jgi:competence protein ComEC
MNRRPLVPAAAALATGIALGRVLHLSAWYMIAAAASAVAALFVWLRRKRTGPRGVALIVLLCAALGLFGAFLTANIMGASDAPAGQALSVSGRVYGEPYVNDYGSTVALLTDARVDGEACGDIKLYVSGEPALRCGDIVKAEAEVALPKGVRNPGGFDERLYLFSQGVRAKAYADAVRVTGWQDGWEVWVAAARDRLSGIMDAALEPEVAPVAKAMLLGDTAGIDEATYTAFKDTGMAHVLAVSGLNAAILVAFVYFLMKLLRVGRTPRLIITLLFVAAYACVTGLTPSVVRAALMAFAVLIGKHLGRQADTLNCLALSFIIALLWRCWAC